MVGWRVAPHNGAALHRPSAQDMDGACSACHRSLYFCSVIWPWARRAFRIASEPWTGD